MTIRSLPRGRFRLLLDYRTIPDHADVVSEGAPLESSDVVKDSSYAVRVYRRAQELGIVPRDRETFAILLLNTRHNPIAFHVVSIGTLDQAPAHPREVFRPALVVGAAAVIVLHNHPSGDPSPSANDRRVTTRLREVGDMIGVPLLDHVVVGDGEYYSFAGRERVLL